jgi:hypothetical protein
MSGLVCYKIWMRRDIRRCARIRGREGVRKEAAGSPVGVGTIDARRRKCGPPMRNQSGLAAQSAAERRGKRRGGCGVLIAGVLMAIYS